MKNFLQNLLIFFALALCGLISVQWVRETGLRKDVQALTDTVHDKSQEIQDLKLAVKRDETEIQRLDGLKNQLTATVKSNQVELARLSKDLSKVTADNERNLKQAEAYKEALKTANESVIREGEDIKFLNAEMKRQVTQYSLVISNLNTATHSINEIAEKWGRMGEALQKGTPAAQREAAVTNLAVMAADFNRFGEQWNKMQQALSDSATNAPASTNAPTSK